MVARQQVLLQRAGLQVVVLPLQAAHQQVAVLQEGEVLQEDLEAALRRPEAPVPRVLKLHLAKASEFAKRWANHKKTR